jgi:O-antigen/teichoic acid export membrane protein
MDKTIIYTKIVGISLIINIILNLILIPKYSLYGASFATLITEAFACIILFFAANRLIPHKSA